jgi:hypothetical protein
VADRVEVFAIPVAIGSSSSAPVATAMTFTPGIVTEVEFVIPPGPCGLVGFFLAYNSQRIIPYQPGAFIITDDEIIRWPVSNMPTGGKWQIFAYNADVYPHTLYVRFLVDEIPVPTANASTLIPIG